MGAAAKGDHRPGDPVHGDHPRVSWTPRDFGDNTAGFGHVPSPTNHRAVCSAVAPGTVLPRLEDHHGNGTTTVQVSGNGRKRTAGLLDRPQPGPLCDG